MGLAAFGTSSESNATDRRVSVTDQGQSNQKSTIAQGQAILLGRGADLGSFLSGLKNFKGNLTITQAAPSPAPSGDNTAIANLTSTINQLAADRAANNVSGATQPAPLAGTPAQTPTDSADTGAGGRPGDWKKWAGIALALLVLVYFFKRRRA